MMKNVKESLANLTATNDFGDFHVCGCQHAALEIFLAVTAPTQAHQAMTFEDKMPGLQSFGFNSTAFSRDHTLHPGWTSSDGVGVQITRLR